MGPRTRVTIQVTILILTIYPHLRFSTTLLTKFHTTLYRTPRIDPFKEPLKDLCKEPYLLSPMILQVRDKTGCQVCVVLILFAVYAVSAALSYCSELTRPKPPNP